MGSGERGRGKGDGGEVGKWVTRCCSERSLGYRVQDTHPVNALWIKW